VRKFKADRIFNGNSFMNDDQVLVTTDDGVIENIIPSKDAGDGVEILQGILAPGFINCHCHLELSHMKGRIPEKTGLVDFVFKVVTERHHSEEEILASIAAGEKEMLENGIVAAGDICNQSITRAQKEKGNLSYYNFIEISGWSPAMAEKRFENALKIFQEFESLPGSRDALVPHAPYSVSSALWQMMMPFFKNKTITIHNQETAAENEFFTHGTGGLHRMYEMMKIDNRHHQATGHSSLVSFFEKIKSAAKLILVHNTFTTAADIAQIKKQEAPELFFCLCPHANLYIEQALPDVNMLRQQGCNLVLGTDSLSSNHALDIAAEINTLHKHFPEIPMEELLGWATSNGSRALGMEETLGNFSPGKKPGINQLLFDQDGSIKKVKRLL
jgi:cytosine/adenosine deaminase-related metal-dependent hydrolase